MNTTTNIYAVHTYNKERIAADTFQQEFRGVYSSKELADKAGHEYCDTQCETWGASISTILVTIKALDDIINGEYSIKTRLTRIKKRVILYKQWHYLA